MRVGFCDKRSRARCIVLSSQNFLWSGCLHWGVIFPFFAWIYRMCIICIIFRNGFKKKLPNLLEKKREKPPFLIDWTFYQLILHLLFDVLAKNSCRNSCKACLVKKAITIYACWRNWCPIVSYRCWIQLYNQWYEFNNQYDIKKTSKLCYFLYKTSQKWRKEWFNVQIS